VYYKEAIMTVENVNGLITVSGTEEQFKDKIKEVLMNVVDKEIHDANKTAKHPEFIAMITMLSTVIICDASIELEKALGIGIKKEEK
jgi:hypothetical protein